MRALVVDDNEDMRELVKLTMMLAGDEVIAEAVDACSGHRSWVEVQPDVLIVDYRMPGHNGLDLAEYILRTAPDANILLFSAFLDDETIARAEEIGVLAVSKDDLKDLPDLARRRAA